MTIHSVPACNISYHTLFQQSSTWHFHITIYVVPKLDSHRSNLTLRSCLILLACIFFCIAESFVILIFYISLLVKIVELYPMSNNIRNFRTSIYPFVYLYILQVLKQINPIALLKLFMKPDCNLCMYERLKIPKNLFDKCVTLLWTIVWGYTGHVGTKLLSVDFI